MMAQSVIMEMKEAVGMRVASMCASWLGSRVVQLKKAMCGLKQCGHEWSSGPSEAAKELVGEQSRPVCMHWKATMRVRSSVC